MIRQFLILIALSLVICLQIEVAGKTPLAVHIPASTYDVVVIGGTPAGVAAAIAAGRAGKSVILIEQSPVLGGVHSSGVIRLDDLYVESNSGVMEEFRQRVKAYHRSELADDPLVKAHLTRDPRSPWNVAEGRAWEPHTAARIYAEMVTEIGTITTRFNEVAVDVEMKGNRVTGVITQDRDHQGSLGERQAYSGKVFIDATYEADLAAFANAISHWARSSVRGGTARRTHLHEFLSRSLGNVEGDHSSGKHRRAGRSVASVHLPSHWKGLWPGRSSLPHQGTAAEL